MDNVVRECDKREKQERTHNKSKIKWTHVRELLICTAYECISVRRRSFYFICFFCFPTLIFIDRRRILFHIFTPFSSSLGFFLFFIRQKHHIHSVIRIVKSSSFFSKEIQQATVRLNNTHTDNYIHTREKKNAYKKPATLLLYVV